MTKSKPKTKSAKVIALLERNKGANIDEICKATNWKSHSVRAFLTGLRKKSFVIEREQHEDKGNCYRITQKPAAASEKKGS